MGLTGFDVTQVSRFSPVSVRSGVGLRACVHLRESMSSLARELSSMRARPTSPTPSPLSCPAEKKRVKEKKEILQKCNWLILKGEGKPSKEPNH
jgi:hypothetical protein